MEFSCLSLVQYLKCIETFAVLNLLQNLLLSGSIESILMSVYLFVSTEQGSEIRTHPSSKTKNGGKHY